MFQTFGQTVQRPPDLACEAVYLSGNCPNHTRCGKEPKLEFFIHWPTNVTADDTLKCVIFHS